MSMNTIEFKEFRGMNNVMPKMGMTPKYQTLIKNMNVQDDFSLSSRDRYIKAVDISNPHSLYQDNNHTFFRAESSLLLLNSDNSIINLKDNFIGNLPLDYVKVNDKVYFSDGVNSGIYDEGVVKSWGIEVPPPPTLDAVQGYMDGGIYRVKTSYVDYNGNESGLSGYDEIEISDNQGISIKASVTFNSRIERVNVYVTKKDSGRFTFYGYTYTNNLSVATFECLENYTHKETPATNHMNKPPSGHLVEFFSSHIVIAVYNALFYTEPFSYELCRLDTNFIQLPLKVNNLISMDRHLIVTTKQEVYIIDKDWKATVGYKGSIIDGSAKSIDASVIDENYFGLGVVIASKEGLLLILGDGRVVNISSKFFTFKEYEAANACITSDNRYILNLK